MVAAASELSFVEALPVSVAVQSAFGAEPDFLQRSYALGLRTVAGEHQWAGYAHHQWVDSAERRQEPRGLGDLFVVFQILHSNQLAS